MWAVLYCTFSLVASKLSEAQIHGNLSERHSASNFSSWPGNISSTSYNASSSFHSSSATSSIFHLSTSAWRNGSTTAASASSLPQNKTIPQTSLNSSSKAVATPPYPVNITRVSLNGTGFRSDASSWANGTSTARNITTTPPAVLPTPTFYPNATTNGTKNACQASYEAYETAYWWWVPTTQLQWTSVLTYDYEYVTFSTELYECTSTCGSICYAGNVTTVRSTSHFYSIRTATLADNPPFPMRLPNCTIPFDECISIQSSYTSASSSWEAGVTTRDWWGTEFEPPRPYCSACSSTACTFNGMFAMSLYYWPPTTPVTRDYCATAPAGGWASTHIPDYNHTYIPKTTGPSAVVNNITMYDGNVYISYWEPQVYDNCGASVSRRDPEIMKRVITVASDALFSIRSYPHILAPWPVTWDLKPYPVNFADFDEPVPWSAYNGQMDCAQPGAPAWKCEAVKPNNYFPYVMMPPQIRDLDPAWANCKFDEYAAFDPPIALRPANMFSSSVVLATPTRDGGSIPQQTPATPGDNGGGWIPVMTPKPTRPQNPGIEDGIIQPPVAQPPVNQIPNGPNPTSGPGANVPIDLPFEGITVGPSVMPVDPSGNLIVQPGIVVRPREPPVIFDGTTMSMGSSGIVVIDQRGTSTLPLPATQPPQRFLTIGTSTLPVDAAGDLIVKPGITLRMRGNALNIDGTTMSLGLNGLTLFAQNSASTIPLPASTPPQSVVTIGASTFTLDKNGGIVLRPNQVLQPGGTALTISGTTYSINAAALTIIDSTGTKIVSFTAAPRQYITVGAQVYTLVNGKLILGPKLTLLGPGGMAIFQGTTVKLQSESVVVESQGGKSTVSIKSKMLESKTQTASTGTSRKSGARKMGVGISWWWSLALGLVHAVYGWTFDHRL